MCVYIYIYVCVCVCVCNIYVGTEISNVCYDAFTIKIFIFILESQFASTA